MKFVSRDGQPKRVASTSGHVIVVGNEPKFIPKHMENEAYAAGCISEEHLGKLLANHGGRASAAALAAGVDPTDLPTVADTAEKRMEIIEAKIKVMIDADPDEHPDYFTTNGTPRRDVLDTLCGFKVDKREFEDAWDKFETMAEED